jgi:hypothetical protein
MYLQSIERRELDGSYAAHLLGSQGREVLSDSTLERLKAEVLSATNDVERVERLFARMAEWEATHPFTGLK